MSMGLLNADCRQSGNARSCQSAHINASIHVQDELIVSRCVSSSSKLQSSTQCKQIHAIRIFDILGRTPIAQTHLLPQATPHCHTMDSTGTRLKSAHTVWPS